MCIRDRFQKSPPDADHTNIVGFSGNAGLQATDPPYDHIDLHAGFLGFDQSVDDCFIRQRIQFESDVGVFPVFCMFDFSVNFLQNTILQTMRCYHQFSAGCHGFSQRQRAKHIGGVGAALLVGGQKTVIGI